MLPYNLFCRYIISIKGSIAFVFVLIILFNKSASAQNCTATLGYPVVYLTFGAGEGVGPPLGPGITTFNFTTGCPSDGGYTITDKMDFCYTNNWHAVVKDHTGDPHGRFMVVNASIVPDDFFVQQVDGLCGGTTYEFASWVLNMISNNGIAPNITFSIEKTDGSVLQSFNTGDIPISKTMTWKQYPFYFTMPQNITSVVIRMSNNAPGGYGNDVALDDITFRPTGPAIDIGFEGQSGHEATVCQPTNTVKLFAKTAACSDKISLQWQQSTDAGTTWQNIPGATASTYNLPLLATGTYMYRTLVAGDNNTEIISCRVISDALTVNVIPATVSTIIISSPNTNVCAGVPVTFTATTVNPGATPAYQWQVNGVNAGTDNTTFTTISLKNDDVVSCILTAVNTCSPPAVSNKITVNVINPITKVTVAASSTQSCKRQPVTFKADVTATTDTLSYQWQVNGKNVRDTTTTYITDSLNNNDVVGYLVAARTSKCALPIIVNADPVKITVNDTAVITLEHKLYTINTGGSVQIKASASVSGSTYLWLPSTGLSSNDVASPLALPSVTTKYILTVTTPLGCSTNSESVTVKVLPIFIVSPNTFTPNGDGINDTWNVPLLPTYEGCIVDVYTRTGVKIFHSIGYNIAWDGTYDGKKLPVGTYYYVIDLKDGSKPYTGYVSLL